MKWLTPIIALLVSGCGGGSSGPPAAVFMGDSITERWPLSDYVKDVVDAGISGQTSDQMLARFQTDVIATNAATVVILAGTNDVLKLQNPTVDNVQKMADMASRAGIHVIIGQLPPNSDWTTDSIYASDPTAGDAAIEAFNADLVMMANAGGYTVVDYYDAMLLANGTQNTSLFVDGTHPDKAGYDAMWSVLKGAL